ncbi:hypothetical protein UCRPA7_1106 [Phaeoacremonium minimum UCRPA7]|uniref:Fringe-like glycosyltransferase domain-containing protein n=1 Tax=Phaeoacremonium minimum (strain UCR-PA7) TaxID=1286976 RepID=R8BVC3_PHAM7|nr:hypothetical protein UCRPA7_1106 [Phaeoacremonium minimum UCRPA7]EOO03270.1 hypothetical protein UCRPA7_1106 [Phaeoacremonium minimum UCRPA7]
MRALLHSTMSRWTAKKSKVAAALLFTTVALWLAVSFRHSRTVAGLGPQPDAPKPEPPTYDLFGIKNLNPSIEIATLNLHASPSNKKPATKYDIPIDLPQFSKVQLDTPAANVSTFEDELLQTLTKTSATATIDVYVNNPTPDASHIIFGAATTLKRLPDALRGFKHWAAHTNAHFVIIVEPHNPENLEEPSAANITSQFETAGVSVEIIESELGYIDRYVSLVGLIHDRLTPKTKWCSIIDDDTFFFQMETLLAMLSKYDTTQPYYVGTTSENKWNVDEGGIWAIGGAGVFISVALLRELYPHAEDCVALPNIYGDGRVSDCVFKYTTTKLSFEHSLYQLDLHGDVTGFYEAVRPQPVSVHHWKSWHHHDMPLTAAVSAACGQPCVLQSYAFRDGWQMTNGFSIVKYSYNETELASQVEAAMEHTWKITLWDIQSSWKYTLDPLKPRDDGKVQFMIEKADVDEKTGAVTLHYVRRRNGKGQAIIRVVWSKN